MEVKIFKYKNGSDTFCSVDFPNFWIPTIDWVDDFIDKHRGETIWSLENMLEGNYPKKEDRIEQGAHLVYRITGQSPIKLPSRKSAINSFYSIPYKSFRNYLRFDGGQSIEKEFEQCMTIDVPRDLKFMDLYRRYYESWSKTDILEAFCKNHPDYMHIYFVIYYLTTKHELCAQENTKT